MIRPPLLFQAVNRTTNPFRHKPEARTLAPVRTEFHKVQLGTYLVTQYCTVDSSARSMLPNIVFIGTFCATVTPNTPTRYSQATEL